MISADQIADQSGYRSSKPSRHTNIKTINRSKV